MIVSKIIIIFLWIAGFIFMLEQDCNGTKAKEPKGFKGVLQTLLVVSIWGICFYFAGVFSL